MTLTRNILITLVRGLHGRFGFLPESERRDFSSAAYKPASES
ncbi:MAG: hypothetical protein V4458_00765 [Pseudomonadota bacterium]